VEPVTIDGLMGKAFMVGIKPHEFWDMTPRELMICIKAYELQYYGIQDGKKISDSADSLTNDEWHDEWQKKWDNPSGELNKLIDN
jgi:hypothetical protein